MIKAITFDLDGVYFINGKSNFISSLVGLGVPEDEAKRVFLKSDEMNNLYKKGKMTDDEFWSWAIKEWNLNMTVPEVINLLIDGYKTDNKVVEIVKKVRSDGYKTFICTNNFPARINGLQERFGFLNDFDIAVFSYEVGIKKPSKEIFQELIKRSGVAPEEIVFTDDDEANLRQAGNLGIKVFFYGGFEGFIKNLKNEGVEIKTKS